ncbi:MAG TPA: hypothetical protein VFU30_03120 [Gaiellaceae bacterium]|nr:hypothetical protein [Gaiellaceae bacterium]
MTTVNFNLRPTGLPVDPANLPEGTRMKRMAAALVLVIAVVLALFVLGAGGSGSASGLRGTVLISPSTPVCKTGTTCSRPAAHDLLRFWRDGKVVARTRTDARGRFRLALGAHVYRVTSGIKGTLKPARVSVAADRYRLVTFRIDIGIR